MSTLTGDAPVIAARHLSVGYGDAVVVREVDLTVHRGETVAVLGANGSGKTTLMRGILGLASVVGGELHLFGVPARELTDRSRIGYVPQRHTLGTAVPATVREVVATGRLARRPWFRRAGAADRAAVADAVETVGLTDRADASVHELSGGQQRRVLIARALAAEPEVLVMDEPTAGVDVASQDAFAVTLERLAGSGVTLLLVTHEIGPLQGVLRRAVVVRAGRIEYDGPCSGDVLRDEHRHDHHHDDQSLSDAAPPALTGLDQPRLGR
ncbi:MAG: metal ABC transporter ATP-binding protein [Actinomycetes bacterium]